MALNEYYRKLNNKYRPTREIVQKISCPGCGAESRSSCVRWKRSTEEWVERKRNHEDRLIKLLDRIEGTQAGG